MKNYLILFTCLFLLQPQVAQGSLGSSSSKKSFVLFKILIHADSKFKEGNYETAKQCLSSIQKHLISIDPKTETVVKTNPDGNSSIITIKDAIEGMHPDPHHTILQIVQAETEEQRKNIIKEFLQPKVASA